MCEIRPFSASEWKALWTTAFWRPDFSTTFPAVEDPNSSSVMKTLISAPVSPRSSSICVFIVITIVVINI